MCEPFTIATMAASAGAALFQGFGAMQAGSANAGLLKQQGRQAVIQANADAANLGQRGAYQLGDMRRRLAGSGNLSGLDLIADSATNLGLDVARIKHGGKVAQASYNAQAQMEKQGGIAGLLGGIVNAGVGVGTQLLLTPPSTGGNSIVSKVRNLAPSAFDKRLPGFGYT